MNINIIGDCAGRFDELMELLRIMPRADLVLSVGDLIDRGPKSREVVEWFMGAGPHAQAVHGNHENMMVEACTDFPGAPQEHHIWMSNGGKATMASYNWDLPPQAHVDYLATRPLWYRRDGLFVSHAPVYENQTIPPEYDNWRKYAGDESGWIWNRRISQKPMPGHFMVYGHNSHMTQHAYITDEGKTESYAACIDDSRHRQLVGMHWPTRELFKVDYLQ